MRCYHKNPQYDLISRISLSPSWETARKMPSALKNELRDIGVEMPRRFDRIQFDWRRWQEGTLDDFTRLISEITDARISYPNGAGKTARDAWRKNSRCTSDKVSGYTARRNERMRANEFGTRPLPWPGRGGVSFSVASDHRDRDRCDQPLRSRCRGQHHRSVLTFSLPPSLSFFLSFLFFIVLPHPLSLSLTCPLFAFRPPST